MNAKGLGIEQIIEKKLSLGYSNDARHLLFGQARGKSELLGGLFGGAYFAIFNAVTKPYFVISFEADGIALMGIEGAWGTYKYTGNDAFIPKSEISDVTIEQPIFSNGNFSVVNKLLRVSNNSEDTEFTIWKYMGMGVNNPYGWIKADIKIVEAMLPTYLSDRTSTMTASQPMRPTQSLSSATVAGSSSSSHMNFCPNCGGHITNELRFCPNCGFALKSTAVVAEKTDFVEETKPAEQLQTQPVEQSMISEVVVQVPIVGGIPTKNLKPTMDRAELPVEVSLKSPPEVPAKSPPEIHQNQCQK